MDILKPALKIAYIFSVIFFSAGYSFSQHAINKVYKQDTEKINQLNKNFDHLKNSNPLNAVKNADSALFISKKVSYLKGIAQSEYNIGVYYRNISNTKKAIIHFKSSLSSWQVLNSSLMIGTTLINIGKCYLLDGYYDSSLSYYLKSLSVLSIDQNTSGRVRAYNALGNLYEARKITDSALNYYIKAEKALGTSPDENDAGYTYNSIGNIYYQQNELKNSLKYYESALAEYQKANNLRETAGCYGNIGNIWADLGNYTIALKYYNEALSIKNHVNDSQGIVENLINIGVMFNDWGRATKNNYYYKKAINQYNMALPFAIKINNKSILADLYTNLSASFSNLKDFENAFRYDTICLRIKDSLFNERNSKAIADMLVKYDTEKKEQDKNLAISKAELKTRQLYYITMSFLLFLALAITAFFFYRQRVRNKEVLAAKNAEISNQKIDELLNQQEIKSFESMIEGQEQERKRIAEDLHDGLGILLSTVKLHFSAIESKLDKQVNAQEQFEKGTALLDEAVQEVRRIAHNMSTGMLTNIGLVSALNDLKDTIEFGSKLKVNLFVHNMEERLDTITEIAIYRIIQELVGNILKHAKASEISINLNRDLNTQILTIIIEDDGVGFDKNGLPERHGIGLKNIETRAARLKGKFSIDSIKEKGTTAIIEIPV